MTGFVEIVPCRGKGKIKADTQAIYQNHLINLNDFRFVYPSQQKLSRPMPLVNENIRILRRRMGLTQEKFAILIGIKRSLVGAYEEGRATPPTENLVKISRAFGITFDQLLNHPYYKEDYVPYSPARETDLFQQNTSRNIEDDAPQHIRELEESHDHSYIRYVSSEMSGEYIRQYNNPSFLLKLPHIRFSGLPKGEYRAFESAEDFALPSCTIIGAAVRQIHSVENGKHYLLVTHTGGMLYRRVFNQISLKGSLLLSADVNDIKSEEIPESDILELWEVAAFYSFVMPRPAPSLGNLERMIEDLHKEIKRLKP